MLLKLAWTFVDARRCAFGEGAQLVRVPSSVAAEGIQYGCVPLYAGIARSAISPGLALQVAQHVVDAGVPRLPSVDSHLDQGLEDQLTTHHQWIGFGYNEGQ
jgi:hypothetical protein